MSMSVNPLETAEGGDFAGCRQLSVFLENRIGQLLRLTRLLEGGDVRIVGLSVEGTVDCAICRMIVNDPDAAREMFADAGFAVSECDMLLVQLPPGRQGMLTVCAALIGAEVNMNYLYPVWGSPRLDGHFLAIQVDNLPLAAQVLHEKGFHVVSQNEL
jgi:hypothetical protein